MTRRRGQREQTRRPLVVPAQPTAPVNRRDPGPDALRACYSAHIGSAHNGARGYDCATCRRYIGAIVDARAARAAEQQP